MAVRQILLLLVLIPIVGCSENRRMNAENKQQFNELETQNRIQKEIGLVFPAGSKLIKFSESEKVVDPSWVAKMVIPAARYEEFKVALLARPSDDTVYHGALSTSTSWWKPSDVVLKKQYLADRQTLVNVLVSRDEKKEIAVYVECAVF